MAFNIIYLDDEPDLCQMFIDNFESDKISVRTFCDPDKAIQEITTSSPDMVFLDYRLPGITGEDVAKKLPSHIPKALVTGDLSLQLNFKFEKVFSKPFDFDEVEAFIQSYIKK